jgi:hypothetical protein
LSSISDTPGGNSNVRPSHTSSSTPSRIVFNSGGFIGTDFAAAGMAPVFSRNATTTIHVPHAIVASNATTAIVRTPAITSRKRPPLDIARGFTGWGISLQFRAAGTLRKSWLTIEQSAQQPENVPTRVIRAPEPVP